MIHPARAVNRPKALLAGALCVGLAACSPSPSRTAAVPPPIAAPTPPRPPESLRARLDQLARTFDGRVGIAVESVDDRWTAGVGETGLLPQQSVSKLWVALATLEQVDRGQVTLDQAVLVRRSDLSVFNQPLRARVTSRGYWTTIDALLVGALAQSDNAANDILVRRAGGSGAVQTVVDAKKLAGIRCGPEERLLQTKIAGLVWKPAYSFGRTFWTERELVDPAIRQSRLTAYLADPDDGATPEAIAAALAKLKRGELLSPASTARLLQILAGTETGPNRLKAGLGPGWSIAHKTGTGQVMGDLATGFNDVGLLSSPAGRSYAVAVMIAGTRQGVPERQRLMADVARAVVEQDALLEPTGAR